MGTLVCGPLCAGYRVVKPIDYEVYPEDENGHIYVATPEPVLWFGCGTTEERAIANFIDTLVQMYELERAERWALIPECYLNPPVKEYIEATA